MAEGTHSGVLVRGDAGSGRRSLADAAAEQYAPERARINVVGTRYGRGIDYGAILFLLAELDAGETESIGGIMAGLSRHFKQLAQPPLVFIEHPDELDPLSGSLLAQLALRGTIFIVVVCDGQQGLGADLSALMRSSDLLTIEVGPLSLHEAETHMTAMLGGPVSGLATGMLWHAAEGNQAWFTALIRESVSTGALRCKGGAWVFHGERVPLGGIVGQLAAARIARLSTEECTVIRTLALHRQMPVRQLWQDHPEALDSLFAAGYIHTLPARAGTARLASRMLRWTMREGGGVHRLAQTDAAVETRHSRAVSVPAADGWERRFSDCEREVHRLLRLGRIAEGSGIAAAFHRELRSDAGTRTAEWVSVNADLLLLRSDLAGRSGDRAAQLRLSGELLALKGGTSPACLSDSQRYLLTIQSAETEALNGNHDRAVALVGQVLAEIRAHGTERSGEPAVVPHQVPALVGSMLGTLVAAGAWIQGRELASSVLAGSFPHPDAIAVAGLWEGVLAVLDADTQTGLHYLEPTLRQLAVAGDEMERELVGSAVALCQVEAGRPAEPAPGENAGAQDPDLLQVLARVLRIQSAMRTEPAQAARSLARDLIGWAGQSASPMARMLVFAVAAQAGCREAPQQLAAAAAGEQGPLADGLRMLADGMILNDPATVAGGLYSLVADGFSGLAVPQHNAFVSMLSVVERRQLAHAVIEHRRARSRQEPARLAQAPHRAPLKDVPELGLLTQRERDVAAAVVEGLSNIQIAQRSAVSIRTVEGHLYQVYAKLRVKGRRELVTHISSTERGHQGARR